MTQIYPSTKQNSHLNHSPIRFVGRGKDRRVESPFGIRSDLCRECGACIDLCPMTVVPCDGPMKPGEERLCGKCESKMVNAEKMPGVCVYCDMGEGFQCERHVQ